MGSAKKHNIHDASYKQFFRHPEMVRSFLDKFLPADILSQIDLETLEPYKSEFISNDQRERRSDIVWKAMLRGQPCYFMLIFEFQSTVDWWMALRVLEYCILLWLDLVSSKELKPGDSLPPVFPIVLYNGATPWNAPLSIWRLLPDIGGEFKNYCAGQQYFLIDEGRVPKEALAGKQSLATIVVRYEQMREHEEFQEILEDLAQLLQEGDNPNLHRTFLAWFRNYIFAKTSIEKNIEACSTIQEAYAMLANIGSHWEEGFIAKGISIGREEGISLGREEGISLGREEGFSLGREEGISNQRQVLRDMLSDRFGDYPADWLDIIGGIADARKLNQLTRAILKVKSPGEFAKLLLE